MNAPTFQVPAVAQSLRSMSDADIEAAVAGMALKTELRQYLQRRNRLADLLNGRGEFAGDWLPGWGEDGQRLPPLVQYGEPALVASQCDLYVGQIVSAAEDSLTYQRPFPLDTARFILRRLALEDMAHPVVVHWTVLADVCCPIGVEVSPLERPW